MVDKLEAWVGRGVLAAMGAVMGWMWMSFDDLRQTVTRIEAQIESTHKGDRYTKADAIRDHDHANERFNRLEGFHMSE